jgi:aminodeoxyfutalosine deaminase
MPIHALKARYVFPVSAPPIKNGMVGIEGQRIVAVGDNVAADTVEDLGNAAILPGLVNAHTHLEFSALTKPLGEPGMGFADWVRLAIDSRHTTAGTDPGTVEKGLRESARFGVTTIAEIAQADWPGTSIQSHTADGTAFFEIIAPTAERAGDAWQRAVARLPASSSPEPRSPNPDPSIWRVGLSPHAPYSVRTDLIERLVELSMRRGIPLAMHLAESLEEIQWLDARTGPLSALLADLGAPDPAVASQFSRPLDYLEMLAIAGRVLIIHGNYLSRDEIGLLSDYAETMAVVYCPRTHEYFKHDRYPLERMLRFGATVCLGTDSRATSPDLDLLAEIRHVARHYPEIKPQTVLQLGTLEGAKALGREREIGSLEPRKYANLAVVPLPQRKSAGPYQLLFDCDEPAAKTWFRGEKVHG